MDCVRLKSKHRMRLTACLCKGSRPDILKTEKELTSWEIMTHGHFSALSKSFLLHESAQTFLHDFPIIGWDSILQEERCRENVQPSESQSTTSALFKRARCQKILSPWYHEIQVSATVLLLSWSGDAPLVRKLHCGRLGSYRTDTITLIEQSHLGFVI